MPSLIRAAAVRWLPPALFGVALLLAWELAVDLTGTPAYIVPAPSLIALTLVKDWPLLGPSLAFTLETTLLALLAAIIGGGGLALLFAQSRILERMLLPYAVVLQVTPIVAVAPLIVIWVDNTLVALLICAWIVAFFPVLSNTTVGLSSADSNLVALFRLYGASRWQTLRYLRIPSALPFFLAGVRISGGLALIGAIVAEFVAYAGGHESGLAYRILEGQYRLDIPRMFAALFLISVTGVAIYGALALVSHLALRRWHDSARAAPE
jgi:NitT/TauT family transport system permease protein